MLTGRALERIFYRTVIVGAVIVAPLFALGASAVTVPPTIAAASNLRFGLKEVARIFHRDTGVKVRLSFGSSGNFARQIRQGAPFELYMSADEVYVLDLARDEFTIGEVVLYAIGRIAIFAPTGSPLQVDAIMQGLRVMIKNGRLKHFAIANPEHAPYGRAAREVLVHAGLWEKILPRLVFGENISQAAQDNTDRQQDHHGPNRQFQRQNQRRPIHDGSTPIRWAKTIPAQDGPRGRLLNEVVKMPRNLASSFEQRHALPERAVPFGRN